MGGVPLWELLRRREVRELIGDRGSFGLVGDRNLRFDLWLPAEQGPQLQRLQRLVGSGSIQQPSVGQGGGLLSHHFILYRRGAIDRLVAAYVDHPVPSSRGSRYAEEVLVRLREVAPPAESRTLRPGELPPPPVLPLYQPHRHIPSLGRSPLAAAWLRPSKLPWWSLYRKLASAV